MADSPSTIGKLNVKVDFSEVEEATAALKALGDLAASVKEQIGAAVDIKRLTFHPGDTIVIRVDQHLPQQAMAALADHARKSLGDDIKVLVLDKGITLDVLSADAA